MKRIIVIGSGLAGLTAAITAAEHGARVLLVSPLASERAQSVMAAGGMNAVLDEGSAGDTALVHESDTLRGGADLASEEAVRQLCGHAPQIARWLSSLGVVFNRDENGALAQRLMAGQTNARTVFAGASTGKQFVTALTRRCRKLEAEGIVERRCDTHFLRILKTGNVCCGAILLDDIHQRIYSETADAVILATGGQNLLFGKTTGSTLCDGSAAAAVFLQGVRLKNLEMIQYHPTTIKTPQKQMLITEAARGEGGRLFFSDGGQRVYFMEEKYGVKGNLKPRDVVSREIYKTGRQVFLDLSFLGREKIFERLREVYDVCRDYIDLDVTKEPIPVMPCPHYFMGGISVSLTHETSVRNLFAAGECAAIYHGANRLGGNSLLGALYGGKTAAENAVACRGAQVCDAAAQTERCRRAFFGTTAEKSRFPSVYVLHAMSDIMNRNLGIVRNGQWLREGLDSINFYIEMLTHIKFDRYADPYQAFSLYATAQLGKAVLLSALRRTESRGAHCRADYPETSGLAEASYAVFDENGVTITFAKDVGKA